MYIFEYDNIDLFSKMLFLKRFKPFSIYDHKIYKQDYMETFPKNFVQISTKILYIFPLKFSGILHSVWGDHTDIPIYI
jgi:hypothetical protein